MKKCNLLNLIFLFFFITSNSYALELVRDVELEEFTKELLSPLTKASNLNKDRIDLYFIKSNQVNAFVTSGQNIFINTELIVQSETYDEYLGVLAHELAHINGGHISRTKEQISTLTGRSIPIYLLGILGILGGDNDAGLAALMVGSASVQDGFLYYSRTQEAAADQAAITLLCKSSQPPMGLESFLKKLDRSTLKNAEEYKYKTTHPLTSDRFNWIKNSYKKYPNCNNNLNASLQKRFELIKAKLLAYTHNESEVIAIYNNEENQYSTYAFAVTNYFNGNQSKSIELIKSLIDKDSKNPYYHELLGEIYFSTGKLNLAIQEQKKAMELAGHENDLYLMMLGSYLLAESSSDSIIESISVLNKSLFLNRTNSYSWYLLAKAYASNDNLALAQYASAERYYLRRDRALALSFAKKAIKNIDKNTVEWYRTNDLIQLIVGIEEKDNKSRSKLMHND
ncbi:M48 family metalloprotease [Pelagibacteraceae bacterium]|nr:M48 family metalloprotease [Pelagibacteraceae bacterium]